MNYAIQSELSPFTEALRFFHYVTLDPQYKSTALSALCGASETPDELRRLWSVAEAIQTKSPEPLRFCSFRDVSGPLHPGLLTRALLQADHQSFSEITADEFAYLITQEVLSGFRESEPDYHAVDYADESAPDFALLFDASDNFRVSPEDKLALLAYLRALPSAFEALKPLFSSMEQEIRGRLPLFRPALEAFEASCRSMLGDCRVRDYLEQAVEIENMTCLPEDFTVHLVPSILYPPDASFLISNNSHYRSRVCLPLGRPETLAEQAENGSAVPDDVLLKALGDPARFQIVTLLAEQQFSVKALAHRIGISSATVSHHLNQLHTAELLSLRVEGRFSYYQVNKKTLRRLSDNLRKLADRAR